MAGVEITGIYATKYVSVFEGEMEGLTRRKDGILEQAFRASAEEESLITGQEFSDETVMGLDTGRVELDTVTFHRCRFLACDFTGASFCNVTFEKCDFSNCTFADNYWKNTRARECKGEGGGFSNSSFKWVTLEDCQLNYANFSTAFWEFCRISGCTVREAFMSEMKFKKTEFLKTDLTGTDFFKTPLKGMDFSDCIIEGIMVSDQFKELAGIKVNLFQAAELAKLMGVKIV